ncbi:MAG: hypothetical protein HQL56_17260 [Magnetococcales bacterium]|nr:hypothetical protein [Magnetococcales bacterium]
MFFFKHKLGEGQVGLVVTPEGVAVAHVVWEEEQPVLKKCFFEESAAQGNVDGFMLAELLKKNELFHYPFVGVLPDNVYEIFPFDAPQVPLSEMGLAIKWRLKDRLDFPVEEAVVEVFDLPGNRPGEPPKSVYVAVAREREVRACIQRFQDAKVTLKAVDIPELIFRNLTSRLEDDRDGMASLYLWRRRGLVMLTKQKTMYLARHINTGLEQLMDAVDGRGTISARELAGVGLVDELALEVQRTMDYFESHFFQSPAASLHIAPMEIPFPNLPEVMADKLGMRVKPMQLASILKIETEAAELDLARSLSAIGAAMRRDETVEVPAK